MASNVEKKVKKTRPELGRGSERKSREVKLVMGRERNEQRFFSVVTLRE